MLYITFAICNDNTGNRYLRGFVKTVRRCRISAIKRIVGKAIFYTVQRVSEILIDIHLKPSFWEFGTAHDKSHRDAIMELKQSIDNGTVSINILMTNHPYIVSNHISHVLNYINTRNEQETNPAQLAHTPDLVHQINHMPTKSESILLHEEFTRKKSSKELRGSNGNVVCIS